MRIALLQMDIALGDVQRNIAKVVAMVKRILVDQPDIIVLPELWNTGYALAAARTLAESADSSDSLKHLSSLASRHRIGVIAGSILERDGDRIYNSSFVIDGRGEVVARYRKMHLFSPMRENLYLWPGDEVVSFELQGARCGLMICYDLRFPELCRELAFRGAQLIFIPSEFPHPRLDHWKVLLRARAIENQLYVIGVNRVGRDEMSTFFGHSMVVDPWGEVLWEAGDEEEAATIEVDLNRIESIRRAFPVPLIPT